MIGRSARFVGRAQYGALMGLAVRQLGLAVDTLQVADLRIPTLHRGGGEPLVFVHGFGSDKESWLTLLARLPASQPVVAFDLPGFGAASPIPASEASAKRQAAVVVAVLRQLGVDRAHLVGSSMGGGIALRLAMDAPERVASLTLLGSVGPWVEKSEFALALERGENPLVARTLADFDRMMRIVMTKPLYIPRTIRAHLASERAARASSWDALFEGFVNAPLEEGYLERLGEILAPTLVIHGSKDRVIHPSTGRALAEQLKRSRHLSLPEVGHVPHMEATRLVADALLEHVRGSSRREVA